VRGRVAKFSICSSFGFGEILGGQKTESPLLDVLTLIVTAYHTKEPPLKKDILSKANMSLECAKITIRLAKDVKALEQRWYVDYEGRLQEIGKQLGGRMGQTQNSPVRWASFATLREKETPMMTPPSPNLPRYTRLPRGDTEADYVNLSVLSPSKRLLLVS